MCNDYHRKQHVNDTVLKLRGEGTERERRRNRRRKERERKKKRGRQLVRVRGIKLRRRSDEFPKLI